MNTIMVTVSAVLVSACVLLGGCATTAGGNSLGAIAPAAPVGCGRPDCPDCPECCVIVACCDSDIDCDAVTDSCLECCDRCDGCDDCGALSCPGDACCDAAGR